MIQFFNLPLISTLNFNVLQDVEANVKVKLRILAPNAGIAEVTKR